MGVHADLKDCVVSLHVDLDVDGRLKKQFVGTGFFVHARDDSQNSFAYLVTAKHVWEVLNSYNGDYARLNRAIANEGEAGVRYVPLPSANKWQFHPDSGVDLAVLNWTPVQDTVKVSLLPLDVIVGTPAFIRSHGMQWPPQEGEEVMLLAMMVQYLGRERGFPVVRVGHIALITDEPVHGKYGLSDYHMIECQSYPGNSGAPVWVAYHYLEDKNKIETLEKRMFLLGVLTGGFPQEEEILKKKEPKGNETVAYYSLGISLVAPAGKLCEILDSPAMKHMRNDRSVPGEQEPVPLSSINDGSNSGAIISMRDFEERFKKGEHPDSA